MSRRELEYNPIEAVKTPAFIMALNVGNIAVFEDRLLDIEDIDWLMANLR